MFSNLGVKLVCLLVALLLWVQVASHHTVDTVVQLPVSVVGLPDSLALRAHEFPPRVGVRLRATRLQLLAADLGLRDRGRVRIDLTGARAGTFARAVGAADVVAAAQALAVDPPIVLRAHIHHRLCRQLPVRVELTGPRAEPKGALAGGEVVPSEVEVCGPEPLVRALDHVSTRPLDPTRRRRGFRQTAALQLPDPDLVLRPVEVEVTLPGVDRGDDSAGNLQP